MVHISGNRPSTWPWPSSWQPRASAWQSVLTHSGGSGVGAISLEACSESTTGGGAGGSTRHAGRRTASNRRQPAARRSAERFWSSTFWPLASVSGSCLDSMVLMASSTVELGRWLSTTCSERCGLGRSLAVVADRWWCCEMAVCSQRRALASWQRVVVVVVVVTVLVNVVVAEVVLGCFSLFWDVATVWLLSLAPINNTAWPVWPNWHTQRDKAGATVWNNLPASLRQTVSAAAFKRQPKTYLFSCAF